jgi:4-amino-4-deoxy-L-arabinose transferase-like glycosyltransferase
MLNYTELAYTAELRGHTTDNHTHTQHTSIEGNMQTRHGRIINDQSSQPPTSSQPVSNPTQNIHSLLSILLLIGLAIVAIIPRLILAVQLDVVTDEVVYLFAGKVYWPLLTHLDIGSKQWTSLNYEHPPLVKLLFGSSIALNATLGHPFGELFAGRIPSVIMGTVLVLAVYRLGRAPFGHTIALIAALALAFSPWLCYFSALAYLDMTMTTFVTLAYLTLWHALRKPWLFALVGFLMGLAFDSKYPSILVAPAIILFTAYYFFLLRPMIPAAERPPLPWRWWIAAIIIMPLSFLAFDPAIWPDPIGLLQHSFTFEELHSIDGNPIYIAGQVYLHVPQWTIAYMVFTKMSAFLTLPCVFFVLFALIKLIRTHIRTHASVDNYQQVASDAYIVIWFLAVLIAFSFLNIAVGTHYFLPLAPSVAIAGVSGLAVIIRFFVSRQWKKSNSLSEEAQTSKPAIPFSFKNITPQFVIQVILLATLAIGPHLIGLITIPGAEGYTTEFFNDNENNTLQVAYVDYRAGAQWIASNTNKKVKVAMIGNSLTGYSNTTNWFTYNPSLTKRLQLSQVSPTLKNYQAYSYLVWPEYILQRGNGWPKQDHVVHVVSGGNTTYCYVIQVSS